jgi:hypothetical protein
MRKLKKLFEHQAQAVATSSTPGWLNDPAGDEPPGTNGRQARFFQQELH